MRGVAAGAAWLAAAVTLAACAAGPARAEASGTASAAGPASAGATAPAAGPGQGWSDDLRDAFYYTPQGSRLIPESWLLALEEPGSARLVGGGLPARTGFLPGTPGPRNPAGLPVGFAREAPDPAGRPWVGLTCAACHTGEVTVRGARLRIDGGPAMIDFQGFMRGLVAALDATLADPTRYARFAAAAGEEPGPLRPAFEAYATNLRRLVAGNWTPEPYGAGRLDAFGHILNAVAADALAEPANRRVPDAPVSYPALWTTPSQRYLQWNGIAANPIGRNTGEVLGVFGTMDLTGPPATRFTSSARAQNLRDLEAWVAQLQPPPWPGGLLDPPVPAKVERGRALFAAECQGCHGGAPYRYTEAGESRSGARFLAVGLYPLDVVGTDPRMLENFYGRQALTGSLSEFFGAAAAAPAGQVLSTAVGRIVGRDFTARNVPPLEQAAYFGDRFGPDGALLNGWTAPPSYKAGPLAGIWATGPYLHNGSVPTLYDLLSPEDERPTVFWVGGRELDPVKVGFRSDPAGTAPDERERLFRFDTTRPGNSNRGHVFPARPLPPEDRFALVEYLKTLEGPHGVR
ncbi:hypothetical protein OPKNFCMD_0770 [Methylobacterium crusticola]|uniref:Cytochrome c domain-containing protein n=1 Tax=Methylobacterium crusticola TaxID=1697972 RepID=A0ABQ4QTF9_9HYPH|nr:di-heme-cytochrome C peroxidase [Methylobacterium crusticola]GJD48055.1 hypothetical protein OPKNFCMD_0770 [Methylobacterium crusticola]